MKIEIIHKPPFETKHGLRVGRHCECEPFVVDGKEKYVHRGFVQVRTDGGILTKLNRTEYRII